MKQVTECTNRGVKLRDSLENCVMQHENDVRGKTWTYRGATASRDFYSYWVSRELWKAVAISQMSHGN